MKTPILLACVTLLTLTACGQTNGGYEWKAKIKVVNEDGVPFPGTLVRIGYYTNSVSTGSDVFTDTNGISIFSHTARSENADISFSVSKEGYYPIWQSADLQSPYAPAKWDMEKTLVLKKIGKPIAMYAKKYVMGLKLPEYGKAIAYDLEIGDWVGPYGKGIKKDIIFQKDYFDKGVGGYYSKVTVSFPKDGDGMQVYTIPDLEIGSGLRSPHEAPQDGYQPYATREVSAILGQPSKNEHDPNRIYLFRVRTVKDHEGNIVSAHYGKIYGDFMQFSYYLNPTPNSRNIEFDPKQNLLGGIQSFEQVTTP
jgi:hypothetical protein